MEASVVTFGDVTFNLINDCGFLTEICLLIRLKFEIFDKVLKFLKKLIGTDILDLKLKEKNCKMFKK